MYEQIRTGGLRTEGRLQGVAVTLALLLSVAGKVFGLSYGDITFFVGSDLHYGKVQNTSNCAEIARATLDRMNTLPGTAYPGTVGGSVDAPRGVLLPGDLTDYSAAYQWSAFTNDWGLNGERRARFPVYEGYGNHDGYGGSAVLEAIKARNPERKNISNISANGYHYSWDWDSVHLVCLNLFPGNEPFSNSDPKQSLEFLADDLATQVGDSGRPVVLFHHYGFDAGGLASWSDQQRTNYYEVIKNYNILLILAGHLHGVDAIRWNGIETYYDGTIGSWAGNFLVVHLTKTTITVIERTGTNTWGKLYQRNLVRASPVSDMDRDGIPDWWESQYLLNSSDAADAAQDPDGDGQSNLAEYIAGTNPLDRKDYFRITRTWGPGSGHGMQVLFSARAGRLYWLERSTDLGLGDWTVVGSSGALGSDQPYSFTDPSPPAGKAYYRVTVNLP